MGFFEEGAGKQICMWNIFSSPLGGMREGRAWVTLQGDNVTLDGARPVAQRQLGAAAFIPSHHHGHAELQEYLFLWFKTLPGSPFGVYALLEAK